MEVLLLLWFATGVGTALFWDYKLHPHRPKESPHWRYGQSISGTGPVVDSSKWTGR